MAAHSVRGLLIGALFSFTLVTSANTQPASPDDKIAIAIADQISRDFAAAAIDDAMTKIANALAVRASLEVLRANAQGLKKLGKSQYVDRIYVRDYGRTTKDLIDKIQFDRSAVYFRYTFTVYNGEWRLWGIRFKTEGVEPFPRGWEHIYPEQRSPD